MQTLRNFEKKIEEILIVKINRKLKMKSFHDYDIRTSNFE